MDNQEKSVIIYRSEDGTIQLEVQLYNGTVWMNQQQMSTLFGRDIKTIGKHIKNALVEELKGYSVVAKFATTASDGKRMVNGKMVKCTKNKKSWHLCQLFCELGGNFILNFAKYFFARNTLIISY